MISFSSIMFYMYNVFHKLYMFKSNMNLLCSSEYAFCYDVLLDVLLRHIKVEDSFICWY